MPLYQLAILAFIQGLTEFLPVSSSGHLIILPELFRWKDQGLLIDIAVHVGTLGAVLLYFRKDVWAMTRGFFALIRGRVDKGGRLFLCLCLATLPAVIFGAALSAYGMEAFRSISFVGWTTLIFGILLYIGDQVGGHSLSFKDVTPLRSFLIGCAQAMALLPGTSRSGASMTLSRFLGFNRVDGARFSFLMSIPAILAAATHTGWKISKEKIPLLTHDTLWAAGLSFLFGLMAIHFMMRWLRHSTFTPFVIYRIALGAALLIYTYKGIRLW